MFSSLTSPIMITGIVVLLLGQMVLTNLSYPSYPELDFQAETTGVEESQNRVEDTAEESRPSCMDDRGEPFDTKLLIRLKRRVGRGLSGLD